TANSGGAWNPVPALTPPLILPSAVEIDGGGGIFVGDSARGCLFKSGDNGATFAPADSGLFAPSAYNFVTNDDKLLAILNSGVFVSLTGGDSWSQAKTAPFDVTPGSYAAIQPDGAMLVWLADFQKPG